MMQKSKDIYLILLLITTLILIILVGGIWYLNFFGFNFFTKGVLLIISSILSIIVLISVLGIIGILLTMKFKRPIVWLILPTKLVISYFLPIIIRIGAIFGIEKEKIQSSFIQVSNHLISPEDIKVKPEEVLILAPHCIQDADCQFRVTSSLENCRRCGKCQVDDLIGLKEKYGVGLSFATGGTLARKIIKETRPKVIVAIACERDLSSGIQDIYPLPVVGVINLRPNGPCYNTKVEINKVEEALKKLLSGGDFK